MRVHEPKSSFPERIGTKRTLKKIINLYFLINLLCFLSSHTSVPPVITDKAAHKPSFSQTQIPTNVTCKQNIFSIHRKSQTHLNTTPPSPKHRNINKKSKLFTTKTKAQLNIHPKMLKGKRERDNDRERRTGV